MRRYRAMPYYFGLWAVIAGLWMALMALWLALMRFDAALTFGFAAGAAVLLAGGQAAMRGSRTEEQVPETAAEAIALAEAREREARRGAT